MHLFISRSENANLIDNVSIRKGLKKAMKSADKIVSGGRIYTMDDQQRVWSDGAIAIQGTEILAIGRTEDIVNEYQADETIDAAGKMVFPGFIDTHLHPALNIRTARVSAADAPFSYTTISGRQGAAKAFDAGAAPDALSQASHTDDLGNMHMFFGQMQMMDKIPPIVSFSLARHSLLLSLKSGVTSFVEGGGGHPDGVAEAARFVGMRGGVAFAIFDSLYDASQSTSSLSKVRDTDQQLALAESCIQRWNNVDDGMLQAWCNITADVSASDELIKGVEALARREGVPITSHTAAIYSQEHYSVRYFGKTGVTRLADLGVLDHHWLGVHMGFFTDNELAIMQDKPAHIAHCPGTTSRTGKGIIRDGRIVDAMIAGVPVGLGTDTAAAGPITTEISRAFVGHKEARADNRYLPAYKVMEMATRDAAKCINREGELGVLASGYKADIVLVDIDGPDYEVAEPLEIFVSSGSARDVHTSIINGRVVMRDRVVEAFDEEETRRDYRAAIIAIATLMD